MKANNQLRVHFVNVNHGDAIVLEFPDFGGLAHFGLVDFGAKKAHDRRVLTAYFTRLVEDYRELKPEEYVIQFACCTHPHDDHFGGLPHFLDAYADPADARRNQIREFWDCGFRTNSMRYNQILTRITENPHIRFVRVAAGLEYKFGDVLLHILGPSIDLRNRFDTFGVGKNDASIVMRIKYGHSRIILTGDAEFASWGKITEEFPRSKRITFQPDALGLAERKDTTEQLSCNLLKVSHHGSKHGSSLEYLKRLNPRHVVFCAGSDDWYDNSLSNWAGMFPHGLTRHIFDEFKGVKRYVTGRDGHLIFTYAGANSPRKVGKFDVAPDDAMEFLLAMEAAR